jgi:hypothetical protein
LALDANLRSGTKNLSLPTQNADEKMPALRLMREAGIFADGVDAGYFYWISLQALSDVALRAVSITMDVHKLFFRKDLIDKCHIQRCVHCFPVF